MLCSALGSAYENGQGIPADERKAADLYSAACEGGYLRGCTKLGEKVLTGKGVAKDEARALALHKQACDGAEMRACKNLGQMYEQGRAVAKDEKRAGHLLQAGRRWRHVRLHCPGRKVRLR